MSRIFDGCLEVCVWAGCYCMMMSILQTSVWNELLVSSSRRHHRWEHSMIILLGSHVTQHIGQIPCSVGHGSFPRSTPHRVEKMMAKRLLSPGCSCCFGFPWGVQLMRRVRRSFLPITRPCLNPTENGCQRRDLVTRGEAPCRSVARDQAGTEQHEAKAKQKVRTAELEINVNREASERRHSRFRGTIQDATCD